MHWKKLGNRILYPHIAIMIILIPIATIFLVYSMVYIGVETISAYMAYFLSAYTLLICCLRVPQLIRYISFLKQENKYVRCWLMDTHLRANVTLYGSLIWNVVYGIMQFGIGTYHFLYGVLESDF